MLTKNLIIKNVACQCAFLLVVLTKLEMVLKFVPEWIHSWLGERIIEAYPYHTW